MGFGGGLESWEDTSALHSCGRQVHFQGKGLLANLISRPQFCSEPDRRPEEPVAVSCDFPGAAPAPPSCAAGVSPITAASDQSVERGILSRLPGKEANCVICAFPVTVANHVGHLEQLALCAFCAEQGFKATFPSGWGSAESSTSELGWARALGLCGHGYFRPPLSLNVICVCCLALFSGPNPFLHSSLQPLCQSCGPFLISRAGKVRVVLLDPYVSGQPVHRVFTAASRRDLPRPFPANRSFLWQAPVGPEKDTISFPNPCDPSVPEGPNPNFQDCCFESGLGAPAPAACGEFDRCPDAPEALSCDVLGAASAPPLFSTEASPRTASLAFVGCGMVCGFHGNETHCVICALPLAVAIHVGHFDQPELCAFCADQEAGAVPPASRHSAVRHGAGRVPSVLLGPYVSGPLVQRVFNAASCQDPPRPFPAFSPLSQAGQPCDASVPRCMPSVPASPPLVALGFRPDSAMQPPLVSGTMALGPSSPRSVAIGFRPDSAVQPPLLRGTVSDSATSGSWPQEAVPRHNVRNHRPFEAAPASEEPCIAEPFQDGSCAQGSAVPRSNGPPESSPLGLKLSPATVEGDPGPDPWVDLGVWFADVGGTAGLCLSCGSHQVLGCSGLHEVRTFLYACSKVYRDNPNGELLTVVRDVLQYCPGCLHSWHSRTDRKGGISQAEPLLSGPLFFHASPGGPTLDEQGDVVSTPTCVSHFPSGKEALLDVKQECTSSLTACGVSHEQSVPSRWSGQQASTISKSRRTRRRQNRRLRKAAVFASTTAFLDSLIEPLPFVQRAPKTPAEEVLARSCAVDQEVVGRWPGGLGGPDVLQSAAAYFVPCDFGSTAWDPGDVASLGPGLCQQVQEDFMPTPQRDAILGVQQAVFSEDSGALLEAVEVMEKQGFMQEGTFVWKAVELAVETQEDVPKHVACWALEDALVNLRPPRARADLHVISANVTSWRKDLCPWIAHQGAAVVLLQETHLLPETPDLIETQLGVSGFNVFSIPGHPTGKGGISGGLAICFRRHLNMRRVHQFVRAGAGFQVAALRLKDTDCYFVNVYLKAGEGFQGSCNAQILANLIPFLRSVNGLFFVAGDFNEDFEVIAATRIEQEAGGRWISSGASTCAGGGNIDFGLLSPSLAAGASLSVDWVTPFAPHAALHWSLQLQHFDVLFPQLVAFRPCRMHPQPFRLRFNFDERGEQEFRHGNASVHLLGVDVQNRAMTGLFASLSRDVEISVFGKVQGRGAQVRYHRRPLFPQVPPGAGWGGAQASFWNRMVVWLQSCSKAFCVSTFARQAMRKIESMWHGETSASSSFHHQLQALVDTGQVDLVGSLLATAKEQHKLHLQQWSKEKTASYAQWIKTSSLKGMRPLFRSVKSDETITVRPFLDAPVQERIYLRWRQWFDLWSHPSGIDHALLDSLKQAAISQACQLPPISLEKAVAFFKQLPSKAPGLDGWTCDMLKHLSIEAVQAILDFFHYAEKQAAWPDQLTFVLISMLPKSEKRERPIALLHLLYRSWAKLRWHLVATWQVSYAKQAQWDKALPGGQVLDIALSRLMLGESVRRSRHHLITLFLDLETFYDRCVFGDVVRSGLSLGYPPLILHQAILTYMGPRYIQSEGSLCPPIWPGRGVLAGCPAAPSVTKLVIHPIAAGLASKKTLCNIDIWIDDLSLDCVHKSPVQVASDCVKLYRGLHQHLVAAGAQVSISKTCFVASSAEAGKAISKLLGPSDPQVKPMNRDLGITSAGGRRRVLGLATHRRMKASGRAKKLNKLAIPSRAHRIRIVRASLCSAGLWGHQAQGVSPKRRKFYRTLVAKHLGRHKLGSLDLTFLVNRRHCEDPHLTVLKQHVRAVARVFRRWHCADQDKFRSTWANVWLWISSAQHPWKRVNGPLAALMAYLLDLGVQAPKAQMWSRGEASLTVDWASPDATRKVWQWLLPVWEDDRMQRVSLLEGCQALRLGVDLTIPNRLQRRKFFNKHMIVNLQALWQGALLSQSKTGWCTLCNCRLNLQHALWDCPFIAQRYPEPLHFRAARKRFPWPSLWLRGLVPKEFSKVRVSAASSGLVAEGLWKHQHVICSDSLVFASDASGGPGARDPRSACVAWALAAYELRTQGPHRVASITCFPEQPLTVAGAEQQAAFVLFERCSGSFDLTVDCKAVTRSLPRSRLL